jgi:anti-anti-sigma factor
LDGKLENKVYFYKESIVIVEISGEFSVFVQDYELLYKEMLAYIKMGIFCYIMNLNGLSYIDSSGVGVIMRLAANAAKHTTLVCVICDQPQILRILGMMNVDKIVHFVKDIDEGIAYFKSKDFIE